ncbi:hypothetical protein AURDEDRAFT_172465 [Auricularia subglabra TFB-10046 SS5]|nr:hypothetical protein AURDEDRAFT_172465 [Auricularia subglabra TFB-10046 SS5]
MPCLQRLTVAALFDAEYPIGDIVPECPHLCADAYTFRLTPLHGSAVLSAEVISSIVACSVHTLQELHLLIHASELDEVSRTMPEPALLQAGALGDRALMGRLLRSCPRLASLTVATEDAHRSDGVHIYASCSPNLRALKVYATYRYWSLSTVQVFQRALEHWTGLRILDLAFRAEHCNEGLEPALRHVCASKRIALRITWVYHLHWDSFSGVVAVGY